jgi:hypothetical protein
MDLRGEEMADRLNVSAGDEAASRVRLRAVGPVNRLRAVTLNDVARWLTICGGLALFNLRSFDFAERPGGLITSGHTS